MCADDGVDRGLWYAENEMEAIMDAKRTRALAGAMLALLFGAGCPLTADEKGATVELPRTARDVRPKLKKACGDIGQPCCSGGACDEGARCTEQNECIAR